jgi:Zn-dependent protease
LIAGFGWAKPVPVDFDILTRPGRICVALAGVTVNLFIAILSIFLMHVIKVPVITVTLNYLALINIILCVFNIVPVPPLDGSRVLAEFLPDSARVIMSQIERYGFIIIMVLLFVGPLMTYLTLMQTFVYTVIDSMFSFMG